MRWIRPAMLLVLTTGPSLQAQTQPPPQSARQALIEMFLSNNPDAFEKHMPEIAKKTLLRKDDTPETSVVRKVAMLGHELASQNGHFETFDTGPTLLVSEQEGNPQKVEVTVEHDSLLGETDEIEVSIHVYKNGQPEPLPVLPRITFALLQEKEIWKLTEITLAAHVPLTDADYLNGVRKKQDEDTENTATSRMREIVSAESSYSSENPAKGYSCTLSELFLSEYNPDAEGKLPDRYNPPLAGGEAGGYRFALSGCSGSPAVKFQAAAVPIDPDSGLKAFCTDQSGALRFAADGKSASCLRGGKPLQ